MIIKDAIKRFGVYILAFIITFGYYYLTKDKSDSAEIIDVILNVFLPLIALETFALNKLLKKKRIVHNFSTYKINNLEELNTRISNLKNQKTLIFDIVFDKKIHISLVNEIKSKQSELEIYITSFVMIMGAFVLIILQGGDLSFISLLLAFSSITSIMYELIIKIEDMKSIKFFGTELECDKEKIEFKINNIFKEKMSNVIRYNSVQEYNKKLYFVLGYSEPSRVGRIIFSGFFIICTILILYIMYINGNIYVLTLFPAILGISGVVYGEIGKKYFEKDRPKHAKVYFHKEQYDITEEAEQIENIKLNNQSIDIVYYAISKIKAMKLYTLNNKS
jgi:hypothetical protein